MTMSSSRPLWVPGMGRGTQPAAQPGASGPVSVAEDPAFQELQAKVEQQEGLIEELTSDLAETRTLLAEFFAGTFGDEAISHLKEHQAEHPRKKYTLANFRTLDPKDKGEAAAIDEGYLVTCEVCDEVLKMSGITNINTAGRMLRILTDNLPADYDE